MRNSLRSRHLFNREDTHTEQSFLVDICFCSQLCWKIHGHSSPDLPVLSNLLMVEKARAFSVREF